MKYNMDNQDHEVSLVLLDVLFDSLGKMARKWRRSCGLPGGASCQSEEENRRADEARRECAKQLEAFIKLNRRMT